MSFRVILMKIFYFQSFSDVGIVGEGVGACACQCSLPLQGGGVCPRPAGSRAHWNPSSAHLGTVGRGQEVAPFCAWFLHL